MLRIGQLPLGLVGLNPVLDYLSVQNGCGSGLLLLPLQPQTVYFITAAATFLQINTTLCCWPFTWKIKKNIMAEMILKSM